MNIEGRNPAGNPLASVVPAWLDPRVDDDRLRLHIGGQEARPGWKILNIQPGAGVDFVGDCSDLSRFCDGTVSVVYASHVLEHLSHNDGLPRALAEIRRILTPDGVFLMSVPDMRLLCEIFLEKDISLQDQHTVMLMLFGGQIDAHDFHCVGFWREYLAYLFNRAGFSRVTQVETFGIFQDSSSAFFRGRYISLNLVVT